MHLFPRFRRLTTDWTVLILAIIEIRAIYSEMDNTQADFASAAPATKKSKRPLIIAAAVLIVVVISGFLLFRSSSSNKPPEVAGTTTTASTPSPTPMPTVDKQTVTIQILNGTGTPGQAGKVSVKLLGAGYNGDNIKTGNATDNVATSSIAAKTGFESTAGDIKSVLSTDYPDIDVSSTSLGSDSAFDIVVTLGGKQYVAPTSTPTPTGNATPTPTPGGTTDTPTPTPTPTGTPTPTLTP